MPFSNPWLHSQKCCWYVSCPHLHFLFISLYKVLIFHTYDSCVLNNSQTFLPGSYSPIHGGNSQLWTNESQTSVSSLDLISKLCQLFLWMPRRHSEPSKCKAECYTPCSWKGEEERQTESGVFFVFCFSVLTNENSKIQALPNKGYVEVCLLSFGSYWSPASPCSSSLCKGIARSI